MKLQAKTRLQATIGHIDKMANFAEQAKGWNHKGTK